MVVTDKPGDIGELLPGWTKVWITSRRPLFADLIEGFMKIVIPGGIVVPQMYGHRLVNLITTTTTRYSQQDISHYRYYVYHLSH